MSKTLSNILTVFKVAKVIAKIAYIVAIIGAVGAVAHLGALAVFNIFIPELLPEHLTGVELNQTYYFYITGGVSCIGGAILGFFMEKYFSSVLNVRTPFTFDGAKKIFYLGIGELISTAVSSLVAVITAGIINFVEGSVVVSSDLNISISLVLGLFFMFLSMVFKHGAELQPPTADLPEISENTEGKEQKEEQDYNATTL